MDWTSWHGGGMWIFWTGVVILFTIVGWWGNRRMTRRRQNERGRDSGKAPEEHNGP